MANNLHNDDTLWLWAAKSAHVFLEWRMKEIMDPVLYCLFTMELFNWMGEDTHLNQTTPAIHHITVMGISLFCGTIENNIKVMLFVSSGFILKKQTMF